jgi:hypothetical protein
MDDIVYFLLHYADIIGAEKTLKSGAPAMQPKPIDSRRLIDIDAQKRTVDLEGVQHLRSLSGHKEHPAETDYDVVHEEAGRRSREHAADRFSDHPGHQSSEYSKQPKKPAAEDNKKTQRVGSDGTGLHLDVEA